MAPEWRIYYDDGATFSSLEGEPHEAPSRGFICVVGYDDKNGRYILATWDHYYFDREADQWWGCDIHGLIDRLCMNRIYAYKLGRTVTSTEYQKIMERADKDPDFPRRARDT